MEILDLKFTKSKQNRAKGTVKYGIETHMAMDFGT